MKTFMKSIICCLAFFTCLPANTYAQGRYGAIVKVVKTAAKVVMSKTTQTAVKAAPAVKTASRAIAPAAKTAPKIATSAARAVPMTVASSKPSFDPELLKSLGKATAKGYKIYNKNKKEEDDQKKKTKTYGSY